MKLKNWGNYPKADGKVIPVATNEELKQSIVNEPELIAQGNHRSYGDSAFASTVIDMKDRDYFLDFDQEKGILHCQSGLLFADILKIIIPKGWILPVLPGTQFVTVGGAIASDIHGKNHHKQGTFGQHVLSIRLMLADGSIKTCGKDNNPQLFRASCGGMGLTGIILDAKIQLMAIKSDSIKQKVIKTNDLKQTFKVFEDNQHSSYSVAWIDCMASDNERGKGLVMLGEFQPQGGLKHEVKSKLKLPVFFPAFILNSWSMKIFNYLYYRFAKEGSNVLSINQFFFPLDSISGWNRMYGKKGFLQYQLVLPLENSYEGMLEILNKIAKSKQGSFLVVLKRMGPANDNLISFPIEGYSLALDFKYSKKLLVLLEQLDKIVIKHKGRLYLCKDARMSQNTFNQGYARADEFRQYRNQLKLNQHFNTQQSQRLSL